MSYMLDTNICIYAIKQNANVISAINANKDKGLSISAITMSELEYGVYKSRHIEKNRLALIKFLSIIEILPYNAGTAHEYGIIRAYLQKHGHLIGNMDLLIAAHAKSERLTLVTNNFGEYSRIEGLRLENWYNDS